MNTDTWKRREWLRCSESRLYFLKHYAKIRHPKKGTIEFEAWPHLVYLLQILAQYPLILILKRKQIGITWLNAGDNLWLATFQDGANIMSLSKGEDEAAESLDYSRFIHDNLPAFLALDYGRNQSSTITFPHMNSKIKALPATKDAGVGFGGATKAIFDEFEYHDYASENYSEVKAMVDTAGGQLVILSTADKLRVGTKFKEIEAKAFMGENNFFHIFFPADILPSFTEEWYETVKKDMADWEVECKYPRTRDEAISTLSTLAFLSRDRLEAMLQDVLSPLKDTDINTHDGLVSVFKPPVIGDRYCIYTDPSDGKVDPFHTVVVKHPTGEEVANAHGKVPADICAKIHDELVRAYDAYNSYEINSEAGGKFAETIKSLDTPKQAPRRDPGGKIVKDRDGQYTTSSGKRNVLWGLEEWVRNHLLTIHDRETIKEFKGMIIPEGKPVQQTAGMHDDRVDAWGGVVALLKTMPSSGAIKIQSRKYKMTF